MADVSGEVKADEVELCGSRSVAMGILLQEVKLMNSLPGSWRLSGLQDAHSGGDPALLRIHRAGREVVFRCVNSGDIDL